MFVHKHHVLLNPEGVHLLGLKMFLSPPAFELGPSPGVTLGCRAASYLQSYRSISLTNFARGTLLC